MEPTHNLPPPSKKNKLTLSLDLWLIVVLLVMVIVGMLAIWRPWTSSKTSDRTVSITGEAILRAEPDEYAFSPSYEFTNADKQIALNELTKRSDEIVAKLKELGVTENKIKTNASDYGSGRYLPVQKDNVTNTYTLIVTATVSSRDLAQKVQDYLVTTSPAGAVTPQATFSDSKRKKLESNARDDATKDARAKAEQSAKNLGFKVGNVKSVNDGSGFGGIEPYREGHASDTTMSPSSPKLTVQPGENELRYSVTVVYYIR